MDLEEIRRLARERRELEWRRDAIRLRGKRPEETLKILFDLLRFAEKINRAKK